MGFKGWLSSTDECNCLDHHTLRLLRLTWQRDSLRALATTTTENIIRRVCQIPPDLAGTLIIESRRLLREQVGVLHASE